MFDLSHDYGVAFVFDPQAKQLADGSWIAWFPGQQSTTPGDSREKAIDSLRKWGVSTINDDAHRDWQTIALQKHLQEGRIKGVYVLTPEQFQRSEISGELEKIMAEIDGEE